MPRALALRLFRVAVGICPIVKLRILQRWVTLLIVSPVGTHDCYSPPVTTCPSSSLQPRPLRLRRCCPEMQLDALLVVRDLPIGQDPSRGEKSVSIADDAMMHGMPH